MEKHVSHQLSTSKSITSAVDLPVPRTPSPSPSPSLVVEPDYSSRRGSLAKRRSWGNKLREAAAAESSSAHPLHLDFDANMSPQRGLAVGDDPFLSNLERPIPHYIDDVYSDSRAGTSSASFIYGQFEHEAEDDGHREDDQAHLTANMSRIGVDTEDDTSSRTPEYSIDDPEIEGGSTPRTRKRIHRYSQTLSPLQKTETAIKSVSKSLRRISLRVVNLANTELEGQMRLGDGNEDEGNERLEDEEDEEHHQPDLKKVFPIRGRALCFLGPKSKIRLALFKFLVHPCVLLSYSSPSV
jgi:voltage-dependent calcium channel